MLLGSTNARVAGLSNRLSLASGIPDPASSLGTPVVDGVLAEYQRCPSSRWRSAAPVWQSPGSRNLIIPTGRTVLQYADDIAQTLLIASRSPLRGAHAFNLGGNLVGVRSLVAEIDAQLPGSASRITVEGAPLPFPEEVCDAALAALAPFP